MRFWKRSKPARLGRRRRWPLACASLLAALLAASALSAEESWVKVVTEHFTLLTPTGETVARKWAIELEQFRRGLQNAVPVPVARLRPVTVVLFKNERAMEAFAPLENGRPVKIGGFFVRANDINTIMLSVERNAAETRQVIFHEAVHWHLSAREGFMPLWLSEGLAEVYATFELPDARTYAFGAALDAHVDRLRQDGLLPLPKLLSVGRDSLLYNEGMRTSIFYAQAWAFVHYLIHGEDSPGAVAVQRYLELLAVVRTPDDAFATAFGADYATFEQRLRRYIASGRFYKHVYPRSTDDIARHLKVGPAAPADVALAKGSLLLGARSAEDAAPYIGRAAVLAPADPRAWELLGHMAVGRKDFATALVVLAKAAAAGSTSYLVHYNLAVSRLPELMEPWTPQAVVDLQAMDAAAADFRHAIQLFPSHIPSYEGLAGVVRGIPTFFASDLPLLVRGLSQSPGNTMIEAGIAAAEIRTGRVVDARARLERLCARHSSGQGPGIVFARRLLESETLQGEIDEINRLSGVKRLDDVIAIADRALQRDLDPSARDLMENVRRRMNDYKIIQRAVGLANQNDTAEARLMLDGLLAHEADPDVSTEARRILREIEKHDELAPLNPDAGTVRPAAPD